MNPFSGTVMWAPLTLSPQCVPSSRGGPSSTQCCHREVSRLFLAFLAGLCHQPLHCTWRMKPVFLSVLFAQRGQGQVDSVHTGCVGAVGLKGVDPSPQWDSMTSSFPLRLGFTPEANGQRSVNSQWYPPGRDNSWCDQRKQALSCYSSEAPKCLDGP